MNLDETLVWSLLQVLTCHSTVLLLRGCIHSDELPCSYHPLSLSIETEIRNKTLAARIKTVIL